MYNIEFTDTDRFLTLTEAVQQGEAHVRHVKLHEQPSVAFYDNSDPEYAFLFLTPAGWEQEQHEGKIKLLVRENQPGLTWIDAVIL